MKEKTETLHQWLSGHTNEHVRTIGVDSDPEPIDGEHEFMDSAARTALCERLERSAAKRKTKAAA